MWPWRTALMRSLRVWLREPVEFDDSISDDQIFWNNRVFLRKPNDEVMITFASPPGGWRMRLPWTSTAVGGLSLAQKSPPTQPEPCASSEDLRRVAHHTELLSKNDRWR
jgi:hypothetical protein